MQITPSTLDALIPAEMAEKAEQIGTKKADSSVVSLFVMALLAGAFIAMGAIFATATTAGAKDLMPYGLVRLITGLSFSLGLILVIVGGAELFTGNALMIMAFASRKISLKGLLRNWVIVYLGNLIGSIVTAYLVFLSKQHFFGGGSVGLSMLATGEAKTSLEFLQAIALGILCNALVCMAVWLTYSARSTADKIFAIIPPITAFVAAGFEHSVANMYYIPAALFVKESAGPAFFEFIGKTPADFPHLTWMNFFLSNLLPVTIGNIIGGGLLVGLVYWFVYLRKDR
jgi:formate transporter